MRKTVLLMSMATLGGLAVGCASPPPPRVAIPQDNREGAIRTHDRPKPVIVEDSHRAALTPVYDDVPIVNQAPPEQPAFVNAYVAVGRPRMAIFVNRTIEGQIIPVAERRTLAGVEVVTQTNAGVDSKSTRTTIDDSGRRVVTRESSDGLTTTGPARITESAEIYLAPGQYDEVAARSLDYEAVENVLSDWLSADGKVTLISPSMTRTRLTDQEVAELQAGRPTVLREIAEKLDADVLIQVQARPTRQTYEGLEVRIIAEAFNTKGGETLGRAFVDVPPPLDKPQINKYTRFLARKLMMELTKSWQG